MKHQMRPKKRNKLHRRSVKVGDEILTDEERERRISELLARGMEIRDELDPIVRETYKDNPAKLAEWDEIMHMNDDIDEDKSD